VILHEVARGAPTLFYAADERRTFFEDVKPALYDQKLHVREAAAQVLPLRSVVPGRRMYTNPSHSSARIARDTRLYQNTSNMTARRAGQWPGGEGIWGWVIVREEKTASSWWGADDKRGMHTPPLPHHTPAPDPLAALILVFPLLQTLGAFLALVYEREGSDAYYRAALKEATQHLSAKVGLGCAIRLYD
jgi:hypothetical protein